MNHATYRESGSTMVSFVLILAILGIFAAAAMNSPTFGYFLSGAGESAPGVLVGAEDTLTQHALSGLESEGMPALRVGADGQLGVLAVPALDAQMMNARQRVQGMGATVWAATGTTCLAAMRARWSGECKNSTPMVNEIRREATCSIGPMNPNCRAQMEAMLRNDPDCMTAAYCWYHEADITKYALIRGTKQFQIQESAVLIPGVGPVMPIHPHLGGGAVIGPAMPIHPPLGGGGEAGGAVGVMGAGVL